MFFNVNVNTKSGSPMICFLMFMITQFWDILLNDGKSNPPTKILFAQNYYFATFHSGSFLEYLNYIFLNQIFLSVELSLSNIEEEMER
jgi:hypothetical protein